MIIPPPPRLRDRSDNTPKGQQSHRLEWMTDHYFSDTPSSPDQRHQKSVSVRGRDYRVQVASGTFSPGGLDRGTRVLLDTVPAPTAGGVAVDVGCGWGPITLALASEAPDASVYAVDVNSRARDLTAINARNAGCHNVTVIAPEDFPDTLTIDTLWSNPPIRIGKKALHELLATWLHRLSQDGNAWLVVAKNLGAESLLTWLNTAHEDAFQASRFGRDKGFHVIHVTKTP
jgi:16S rRNA (guanine1207-N2)-methyltransferase